MAEEFSLTYTLDPMLVQEAQRDIESGADDSCVYRRGRKRVKDPDNWKKKHKGKKTGLRENAPAISIDDIKGKNNYCCTKLCVAQLSANHLLSLRQHFGTLMYDEQNLFLSGLIVRRETKKTSGHRRKSNPTVGKNGEKVGRPPAEESACSIEYQIRNEKGLNKKVCQKAFLLVFGFGKRRLEILRKKFRAGSILPELDRRGKHDNRPKKIPELIHKKIVEHIESFPTRQNHYSRHKNSQRLYLSPDLSIERMYEQFLEKHNPEYVEYMKNKREALINHCPPDSLLEIEPIVSKHYYHDVFVSEFNLHFGYPHSDTCDTCDSLKLKIDSTVDDEKSTLEEELQRHHEAADKAYVSLHKDISLSKQSWSCMVK